MDDKLMQAIEAIIRRGNDAEIPGARVMGETRRREAQGHQKQKTPQGRLYFWCPVGDLPHKGV